MSSIMLRRDSAPPPLTQAQKKAQAQQLARNAVATANEGYRTAPDSTTTDNEYIIAPFSCTDIWKNGVRTLASLAAPTFLAGFVFYQTTVNGNVDTETAGIISAAVGLFAATVHASAPVTEQMKEFVRIGATQLASQSIGFLAKFGLEQLSLSTDPSLSAQGQFNGTHWASAPGNFSSSIVPWEGGNATINGFSNAYGINHEEAFPGGTAWVSLAVVGIPAYVQLTSFLVKVRGGTTAADALANRLSYDASGSQVISRLTPNQRDGLQMGGKAGVVTIAVALVAGMGAGGQRKLMMRVLSGVNSVMLAARVRDYINHAVRGATSGGIVNERWADGGLARQQQISIPAAVTNALRIACTKEDETLDTDKFAAGMKELKEMYRDFFVQSRGGGMVLYTAASYFGLSAMREYFSPSIPATFARGIGQSFSVTVPYLLGTSFVEGEEEPGWFAMAKAVGGWKGLPFAIARAPDDIDGKIRSNLDQISITATLSLVPFQPWARGIADSFYGKSSVNEKREVTISHADSLEMHAGIRAGQNMATVILFTSAGVATQPEVKTALFAIAALLNGATHWRGNVVAQILQSGREAHLLFEFDAEKRFGLRGISKTLPKDAAKFGGDSLIVALDEFMPMFDEVKVVEDGDQSIPRRDSVQVMDVSDNREPSDSIIIQRNEQRPTVEDVDDIIADPAPDVPPQPHQPTVDESLPVLPTGTDTDSSSDKDLF